MSVTPPVWASSTPPARPTSIPSPAPESGLPTPSAACESSVAKQGFASPVVKAVQPGKSPVKLIPVSLPKRPAAAGSLASLSHQLSELQARLQCEQSRSADLQHKLMRSEAERKDEAAARLSLVTTTQLTISKELQLLRDQLHQCRADRDQKVQELTNETRRLRRDLVAADGRGKDAVGQLHIAERKAELATQRAEAAEREAHKYKCEAEELANEVELAHIQSAGMHGREIDELRRELGYLREKAATTEAELRASLLACEEQLHEACAKAEQLAQERDSAQQRLALSEARELDLERKISLGQIEMGSLQAKHAEALRRSTQAVPCEVVRMLQEATGIDTPGEAVGWLVEQKAELDRLLSALAARTPEELRRDVESLRSELSAVAAEVDQGPAVPVQIASQPLHAKVRNVLAHLRQRAARADELQQELAGLLPGGSPRSPGSAPVRKALSNYAAVMRVLGDPPDPLAAVTDALHARDEARASQGELERILERPGTWKDLRDLLAAKDKATARLRDEVEMAKAVAGVEDGVSLVGAVRTIGRERDEARQNERDMRVHIEAMEGMLESFGYVGKGALASALAELSRRGESRDTSSADKELVTLRRQLSEIKHEAWREPPNPCSDPVVWVRQLVEERDAMAGVAAKRKETVDAVVEHQQQYAKGAALELPVVQWVGNLAAERDALQRKLQDAELALELRPRAPSAPLAPSLSPKRSPWHCSDVVSSPPPLGVPYVDIDLKTAQRGIEDLHRAMLRLDSESRRVEEVRQLLGTPRGRADERKAIETPGATPTSPPTSISPTPSRTSPSIPPPDITATSG